MIKNKKATIAGRKVLFYIIFAFAAAITALLLIYITTTDASELHKIPAGLETHLAISRFLYSPACFAYEDESIGRSYSLIDWSKFTDSILRNCYPINSTKVKGFELTLTIENKEKQKQEKTISTANWEGLLSKKIEKKVVVLKEEKYYNGKLEIGIQNEKR